MPAPAAQPNQTPHGHSLSYATAKPIFQRHASPSAIPATSAQRSSALFPFLKTRHRTPYLQCHLTCLRRPVLPMESPDMPTLTKTLHVSVSVDVTSMFQGPDVPIRVNHSCTASKESNYLCLPADAGVPLEQSLPSSRLSKSPVWVASCQTTQSAL